MTDEKGLTIENQEDIKLLRSIATTLHTLLCNRKHNSEDQTCCQFYSNEIFSAHHEDLWAEESHKDWIQITKVLMKLNHVQEKEMFIILENISKVILDISNLLSKYPKMYNIIKEVIESIFTNHPSSQN